MENLRVKNLKTTANLPTPEDIVEVTMCMMSGMVTTQTGGDQDILAVIKEHITTITTTQQCKIIADTVSPSTSTDSRMTGSSTGGLDRADTTRNSTDTNQNTVRTDIENKNRGVENHSTPEIMRGIIINVRPTNYLSSAR